MSTSQSNGASRVEVITLATHRYQVKVDGEVLQDACGRVRTFQSGYAADKAGRAAAAERTRRAVRPDWFKVERA